MPTLSSISRVPASQKHSRRIRQTAGISSVIALILIAVLAVTFIKANDLMRQPAKPLDTFSNNTLPPFNLVSFPSLDEQTQLQGWYFSPELKAGEEAISTVILVHDQGKNRLQFGLESAELYEFLLDQGFCVLAFDLRRSGQSEGQMSSFGYAEWADVLAAIGYVRKNAATHDVLLYGFGTGVSASLLALDHLPTPGLVEAAAKNDQDAQSKLAGYSKEIKNLGFDQSYIRGLMLDTPCSSPDEYIQAVCREDGWLGEYFLQYTVPYAIRFSAGTMSDTNLTTILTRCQLPIFLTYSQQTAAVSQAAIKTLVDERLRLHPDTTMIFTNSQPGFIEGYLKDHEPYLAAVESYLKRYFSP